MTPRARVARFLEGCDKGRKLAESEDLPERLAIEAENDALLLASIELQLLSKVHSSRSCPYD